MLMENNYSINHSVTRGGDDVLHDHFNDDLEVPIDDLTDAQVRKFNFLNVWPII